MDGYTTGLLINESTLGIIYTVIARDTTVLASHAACHGNFTEVSQQVLQVVTMDRSEKLSYASGEYMYHYICVDGIVYLCITDDDFERSKAFLYLENIKEKFQEKYGSYVHTALPYAMNSEFSRELSKQMTFYSRTSLSVLNSELEMVQLQNIRVKDLPDLSGNVEVEQLEIERSQEDILSHRSLEILIRNTSRCRICCQRHYKTLIVVFLLLLVACIIIGAILFVLLYDDHA